MGIAVLILFGVLLPAVTLAVELHNGMCGETFFDPIPSIWHVLLVGLVPLANLLGLLAPLFAWTRARTTLLWANGVAIGVSAVYALVFLPLTPIALIGIAAMGIGLLPLSPLCSTISAFVIRRGLIKMDESPGPRLHPSSYLGISLGILALIALEAPLLITDMGLELAVSDSQVDQARGLRLLRVCGSENRMLERCYDDTTPMLRLTGLLQRRGGRVSREDAQAVYFRVTGTPFNAVERPIRLRSSVVGRGPGWDEFDFDPDLGGEVVAGRRKGLSLASSRIDGTAFGEESLAYVEWTLVFENQHRREREARAQILLPPGGVVSRLTLWVDGEPREAAFAGTAQVRKAYQEVAVEQRRDPVLVTWAGVDRVMMQCFPVPAHGEMKVRLGITTPLLRGLQDKATLRLPSFTERNFGLKTEQVHSVWIESTSPLESPLAGLTLQQADDEPPTLQGLITNTELAGPHALLRVDCPSPENEVWTPDLSSEDHVIVQRVRETQPDAIQRVVIIVDGSVSLASHLDQIAVTIVDVAGEMEVSLLVADDETTDLSSSIAAPETHTTGVLKARLHAVAGVGGCDNVPALIRAWDLAAEKAHGAVVWIHGPQPVVLGSVSPLAQRLERRPGKVPIYDLQIGAGPNRIVDELGATEAIRSVRCAADPLDDLRGLFDQLAGRAVIVQLQRDRRAKSDTPSSPASSDHVARLWALDEVQRMIRDTNRNQRKEAAEFAAGCQLVTPLSGAVVLETQQQYDEAGLEPVNPTSVPTVPTIPEPHQWLLMAIVLAVLLWEGRRRWALRRTA